MQRYEAEQETRDSLIIAASASRHGGKRKREQLEKEQEGGDDDDYTDNEETENPSNLGSTTVPGEGRLLFSLLACLIIT